MISVQTEPLETRRLSLTPLATTDDVVMLEVLSDPELYRYIGGRPPTANELKRQYRSQVAGSPRPHEKWHNWVLRVLDHGSAIGFVQATVTGSSAEIAWVIGTPAQRQGYAAEAAGEMCRWLTEAGVDRLVASIKPGHIASERVAAKLGLEPSGELDDDGEAIWTKPLD